ncbi:MAG: transposase [Desulfobacterales bacterium]
MRKLKWQRCVVHFIAMCLPRFPKAKVKDVAAMLKAIHAQEDREAAEEKIMAVTRKLKKMRLKNAADMVSQWSS